METTNYKNAGTHQNAKTMTSRILQVAVEVGLYVILATFDMLLAFNKVAFFLPFRQGFFCSNQDLMYPYKEMSFKSSHVALISVLPTTLTVLVTEFFRNRRRFKKLQYIQLCYLVIGPMLFGLSLCVFFVEMTKSCVGSLRPYFFAVCQPNMTITNCTGTEYIMDYVCTQKYEDLLIDARKSFPSGHTASAWYGMTFLAIYIHLRISRRWRRLRLFCALVQMLVLCFALYAGVSRFQDNAHRPIDISAGAVIGIIFALTTVFSTPILFKDIRTLIYAHGQNGTTEYIGERAVTLSHPVNKMEL